LPDQGVPLLEDLGFPIPSRVCKIACDVAETAAAATCAVLAPELIAAYIAGAEIARQSCRDEC